MDRLTKPLFRFDPGWLFIVAGVVVCAAGVLLPAQADLRALQMQLDQLRGEEVQAYARLKAHSDFMDQVDRADPALIRRLAATQLNMVPEGDTPVLLAASATVPVTHWIESAVQVDLRPPNPAPDTVLSRLANGPYRLWMFGGGIMCVFMGLMLGPAAHARSRATIEMAPDDSSFETESLGDAVAILETDEPPSSVSFDESVDHVDAEAEESLGPQDILSATIVEIPLSEVHARNVAEIGDANRVDENVTQIAATDANEASVSNQSNRLAAQSQDDRNQDQSFTIQDVRDDADVDDEMNNDGDDPPSETGRA